MSRHDLTPLVIVGAGGLGRETLAAVRAINDVHPTWDAIGFVDDAPSLAGASPDGVDVIGPLDTLDAMLSREDGVRVILSTGRPGATSSRARFAERFGRYRQAFATIVHPTASIAAGTTIGEGSILLAGVVATAPIHIGRHVVAMPHVVFTHDDHIGDFATFATRATLGGGVHVGDGAYLGAASVIRENLTVGARALVGMGAVVIAPVPPDEVWAGIPARRLRHVDPQPAARTGFSDTSVLLQD